MNLKDILERMLYRTLLQAAQITIQIFKVRRLTSFEHAAAVKFL